MVFTFLLKQGVGLKEMERKYVILGAVQFLLNSSSLLLGARAHRQWKEMVWHAPVEHAGNQAAG